MKKFLILFAIMFGTYANAKDLKIPYIYDSYQDKIYNNYTPYNNKYQKIEDIDFNSVRESIKSIRKELCKTIGKGYFRVWLKMDVNAKIWGIGASSEGGIEVNVNCTEKY